MQRAWEAGPGSRHRICCFSRKPQEAAEVYLQSCTSKPEYSSPPFSIPTPVPDFCVLQDT